MVAQVPVAGDQVPQLGNAVTRWLGRLVLAVYEWRIEGTVPNRPKFLVAIAPHTSIWDFVFAFATMLAIGFWGHWLMATGFFKWPLGPVVKALGATPVDRSRSQDMVGQMVDEFNRHEQFVLGIAPEGTRRKVEEWKSGFYHIAHKSKVPIVPVSLDFGRRLITIGPEFVTTGDYEQDLVKLKSFYQDAVPRHPEKS